MGLSTIEQRAAAYAATRDQTDIIAAQTANLRKLDLTGYPGLHGTGATSDIGAINAALAAFNIAQAADSELAAGYGELTFPPGATIGIDRTIALPYNLHINFNGCKIVPLPGAGGTMGQFTQAPGGQRVLFATNTDTATGNQIVNYSGNALPTVRNGVFLNPNAGADVLAFLSKSKHSFRNFTTNGIRQFYQKPSSASGYDYTDLIHFTDLNLGKLVDSADYAIEIGYHGDGVRLEGVHTYKGSVAGYNKKVLRADRSQGAKIFGQINGDIYATRCKALSVENAHMEFGILTMEATDATIRDSMFWVHPEAVAAGYVIAALRTAGDKPSGMLAIENVNFTYLDGKTGLPQAAGQPDFAELLVDVDARVSVREMWRSFNSSIDPAIAMFSAAKVRRVGEATPWTAWEDRSSAYSQDAKINGASIKSKITSVTVPAAIPSPPTMGGEGTQAGNWKAPSGNYLYRMQVLFGPLSRKVGVDLATTWSVTMTQNTGGTRRLAFNRTLGTNTFLGNATLKIYRSSTNTPDQYDAVMIVPGIAGLDWCDTGYMAATGEQWQARAAGPVDSLNTTISELILGDGTATYIGSSAPAAGSFVTGDRFIDNVNYYDQWIRNQATQRWLPMGSSPQVFKNPDASSAIGGSIGYYVALCDTPVGGGTRTYTLTNGRRTTPGLRTRFIREVSATGGDIAITDGTTTWTMPASANRQVLEFLSGSNGQLTLIGA